MIERIKLGTIQNSTHFIKSFLTHTVRVFGFVDEKPLKTVCFWEKTKFFYEGDHFLNFLTHANKLSFFQKKTKQIFMTCGTGYMISCPTLK